MNQSESPLVSIICITYNHAQYITDAIDGFLKQETRFPFEIIIHDDASTDETPAIIKRYQAEYPDLIKPIFQSVNQTSTIKNNALLQIILTAGSHAKGNYIAYCDGDDYWIDTLKLQHQIDAMQQHPECDMSFHPVFYEYAHTSQSRKIVSQHADHDQLFKTPNLILGAAGFCPTTSFVFRKSVFDAIPNWLYEAPCTDYFLQILSSLRGGAIYLNRIMAVYRVFSSGSWTNKMQHDEKLAYDYFTNMQQSLNDVNDHTNRHFDNEFTTIKKKLIFHMSIHPALSSKKHKMIYRQHKNEFGFLRRCAWHVLSRSKTLTRYLLAQR